LARITVPMEKVKLFRAEIDLVNIAMLFPMEETGAEGGPEVPRLGMSNFMFESDSVRKSGEEQGEVGEEEEVEEVEEEEEGEVVEEEEEGEVVEVGISGSPDSVMVARLFVTRPISPQF